MDRLRDWTVWHMLDEDTAVVVITDIVKTESVVAAAVIFELFGYCKGGTS